MLATLMTKVTTVVMASMRGVAATRTPARNVARATVTVPATTLTSGKPMRRYVEIGDNRCPTNGAAMTMATSVVDPPSRRTTMGMNVMRTAMYTPPQMALNVSIRKLRRTRAGAQLPSMRGIERYRPKPHFRKAPAGAI